MAFHCMNCNGSMVFDIESQKMRCLHCDSVCDPKDFVFRDQSPEASTQVGQAFVADGGMAVFTCQNCGAELEGTEDSIIGFCPYCGGQSMIKSAAQGSEVERIIPFQVSKDRCVDLYKTYTRGVRYLPRELKDPEFIQKFTGIYMPFYQYDAEFGKMEIKGKKTVEHNRRYDVVNHYLIEGEVEEPYDRGVTFDGSKYLDDEISERSLPFDASKEQDFNPAYLSGFYADASSVPAELYYEDAKVRAEEDIIGAAGSEVNTATGIDVDEKGSTVETEVTGHHSVLYPLWFLTWRKDERVAYAVINGESGKVVSDMPLELRSFGIGCAIISVALFLLLELLVQPTPLITSIISLIAAFLMAMGIKIAAKREYDQQLHVNDKGWAADETMATGEAAAPKKRRGKGTKVPALARTIVVFLAIAGISLGLGKTLKLGSLGASLKMVLPVAVILYAITVLVRILKWREKVAQKDPLIAIAILFVTVLLNTAIVIISPVNDGWYYLGDAVCILGLVASSVGMLRMYNVSTTRPLPKLFDRAEVEA